MENRDDVIQTGKEAKQMRDEIKWGELEAKG